MHRQSWARHWRALHGYERPPKLHLKFDKEGPVRLVGGPKVKTATDDDFFNRNEKEPPVVEQTPSKPTIPNKSSPKKIDCSHMILPFPTTKLSRSPSPTLSMAKFKKML